MVLGNMILDKTEIEHYGPLGLDDFPTGLRVTCTLHHGKPRDTTLIENMYVLGHSRIYVPMGPDIDKLYAAASDYKDSERYKYRYGTYFSDRRNSQSGADSENLVSNPNGEFVRYDTDSIVDQTTVNVQELYFGTTNTKLILNAGKEVAYGAQPIDSNNKGTTSPADGNGGSVQI
jgi:hypothetical protein